MGRIHRILLIFSSEEKKLHARGREDADAIEKRLARASLPITAMKMITFDNSDELSISGERFLSRLKSILQG